MLTLPYLGISQAITWANKVEFEYNPYESTGLEWTGEVALGAPDAFPYGELSPRAFRLKTENLTEGSWFLLISLCQQARFGL